MAGIACPQECASRKTISRAAASQKSCLGSANNCRAGRGSSPNVKHELWCNPTHPYRLIFAMCIQGNPPLGSHDLFDAKRFLGRTLRDAETQRIREMNLPYAVVPDEQQRAVFRIVCNKSDHAAEGRYHNVLPGEVSTQVLKHALKPVFQRMRENAKFIKEGGRQPVVITIPAAFPDSQRRATREAAEKAGLDVKLLLPEPTAAALAYFHANPSAEVDGGKYLVFDFGGGTLDVSILKISRQGEQRHHTVLACEGDTFLGGRDIDELLFKHFTRVFAEKLSSTVDTNSVPFMSVEKRREVALKEAALRSQVRQLKHELAVIDEATFDASTVLSIREAEQCEPEYMTMQFGVMDLQKMLREKESAPSPTQEAGAERPVPTPRSMEDRMMSVVNAAMQSAKLKAKDLEAILFAGGSSQIYGIDAIIHKALGEKVRRTMCCVLFVFAPEALGVSPQDCCCLNFSAVCGAVGAGAGLDGRCRPAGGRRRCVGR